MKIKLNEHAFEAEEGLTRFGLRDASVPPTGFVALGQRQFPAIVVPLRINTSASERTVSGQPFCLEPPPSAEI